jgi:hypothetical protein
MGTDPLAGIDAETATTVGGKDGTPVVEQRVPEHSALIVNEPETVAAKGLEHKSSLYSVVPAMDVVPVIDVIPMSYF